jgi:hypothetical protein
VRHPRAISFLALTFCAAAALGAGSKAAAASSTSDPDPQQVATLVAADLAALNAASSTALVPGAPSRDVVVAGSFVLEHSEGHALIVLLGLAPGEPGHLPVATEIEYLRYTLHVETGGKLSIAERPARADLVTGVTRVLADEGRALEAAVAAMARTKAALPAGKASWREALRSATYDARLPRERFAGEPSWQFLFDPWDEAHGGYHGVLLSAGLGVEMVDGRAPQP